MKKCNSKLISPSQINVISSEHVNYNETKTRETFPYTKQHDISTKLTVLLQLKVKSR